VRLIHFAFGTEVSTKVNDVFKRFRFADAIALVKTITLSAAQHRTKKSSSSIRVDYSLIDSIVAYGLRQLPKRFIVLFHAEIKQFRRPKLLYLCFIQFYFNSGYRFTKL